MFFAGEWGTISKGAAQLRLKDVGTYQVMGIDEKYLTSGLIAAYDAAFLVYEKYPLDECVEKTGAERHGVESFASVDVLVKLIHVPPLPRVGLDSFWNERCDQPHNQCLSTEASTQVLNRVGLPGGIDI